MRKDPSSLAPNHSAWPGIIPDKPRRKLTESEAFDYISQRISIGDKGRDPTHYALQRRWYEGVAAFVGITDINEIEGHFGVDLEGMGYSSDDELFKTNLIFRHVMQQVSLMTTADPNMSVLPESMDPDDMIGAQVGERFLRHYDRTMNFRGKRRDLGFWTTTCGNAMLTFDWDAMAGDDIESYTNPYSEEPIASSGLTQEQRDMLRQFSAVTKRNEGDIWGEVISPFQVTIPRGFRTIDALPYIVIEYERSLDWVSDHHPKKLKEVNQGDFDTAGDGAQYWRRLVGLVERRGYLIPSAGDEQSETVRVYELWRPPSKSLPNGLWIRSLRSTILDHGPHPYHEADPKILKKIPFLRLPCDHYQYAPVPGRFWAMGLVEHLVGLQRDYNRARTQSNRQRDLLGHPQYMAPMGTRWNALELAENTVLEYGYEIGKPKPERMNPPPASPMVLESMDRDISDMRLISAQGEAVQGVVPQGLRSGTALRALQEKDNLAIKPTIDNLEENFERSCTRLLTLTHLFMDVPRMVGIYGETMGGDVKAFKGSDLHGNVQVSVRRGSMMPKSKAESQQMMLEMVQAGIVNPADKKQLEIAYKSLEVDGANKLFESLDLSRRRAQLENMMFMRPEINPETGRLKPYPDVREYDVHESHLEEHDRIRHSDIYESWSPIHRALFDAHCFKHEMAIFQSIQAMQTAMQATQGGGSPPRAPGEASQPAARQPTPGAQ